MSDEIDSRPMRRKDREIADRSEIDAILREGKIMNLALCDGEVPFLVPLFYAYDGKSIYFHSARQGSKVEILRKNNLARFAVSLAEGTIENEIACDFEARHRTVIGLGKVSFVEEIGEKRLALDMIVGRFSPRKFSYDKAALERTLVARIDIESIKGKKHGY
jgi:uncharacterized protein